MLKAFTPRLYQQTLLATAVKHNTLIVLPTGLGKTATAFMLTAQRLTKHPQKKILMLAPTKPLCEQHVTTFAKHLNIPQEKIVLFTGSVSPKKRAQLWQDTQIIISTPQGIENDVINKRINLQDVSTLIIDEAHRATGEYAYVWVAKQYAAITQGRILALTASPGSSLEKIKEVCANLHIEKVEVRTPQDPDVRPYMQEVETTWVPVIFPPTLQEVHKALKQLFLTRTTQLKHLGFATTPHVAKGELLGIQRDLQKKLREQDTNVYTGLSLVAEAMKIDHALELLESQGIAPLRDYLYKLQEQANTSKVKAVRRLVSDPFFRKVLDLVEQLKGALHTKQEKLLELIKEKIQQDTKIIVFTQYRDTAKQIITQLEKHNISHHIFLGQAKKKGLGFSQKEQKEILDKFRTNQFQVLVTTSVSEEGLDIPKVDHVIFYEPIPSAIRHIQRAGRTGRLEKGTVTVLLTKGTRDEAYRWSAHHKEKKMYKHLATLKQGISLKKVEQPTLTQFIKQEQAVTIVADHREQDNKITKELISLGVHVTTTQLLSADYILSGSVGVELKKIPDFVASLIDGRLIEQLKELKRNFAKALLILEGEENIYSIRKVHPNAINGMLATIAVDFAIPIVPTKNPQETAQIMATIAKREQQKQTKDTIVHKKVHTVKEQQEYLIAALPHIGKSTAKKLLQHFSTIQAIITAPHKELAQVPGVGKKIAQDIKTLVTKDYQEKG